MAARSNVIFVGRARELTELNLLLDKRSASLVTLHGRRRIGKSRLVREFAKKHRFLQFSGIPPTSETTAQSERNIFTQQLTAQTGLPEAEYDDWSKLFDLLATQVHQGRVIILLDEISWMASKDPDFLGKLKNAWDMKFSNNPELILILCGSVSTWMEENILSSTGFMGRMSLDLILDELSLAECNQLLKAKGSKTNAYEKSKILAITGGIPRYLEEIKPTLSADENIRRLCFMKSGILFREFEDIFHDLFTTKSQYYKKIVEILGSSSMEYSDICKALGVEKGGFWSQYLDELIKAGFLKKDYSWNIKTNHLSRLNKYRLSDNYLRFYLKFIEPNKHQIELNDFSDKAISAFPGWDSIMGLQFENLILSNTRLLWQALNLNPNDVIMHGPYFQHSTKKQKCCQIDYLIKTKSNILIACEIKFSRNSVNNAVISEVQEKIARLSLPRGYACWPVLIHINGVSESIVERDYFTHIIDFTDLLEK